MCRIEEGERDSPLPPEPEPDLNLGHTRKRRDDGVSILIPLSFSRKRPLLARAIRHRARNQHEADVMLAKHIEDYIPTYNPNGKRERRARERNRRIQMGGTYSLEHCQGGARYHRPSPDTRPDATWHPPKLSARVDVPESLAQPAVPVARVAPKSYLHDRPAT